LPATDIRPEWAKFLKGYQWDYFLTATFRKPRREPYYAMKGVWNELKRYNVARAFMGVEPHQSGDLHIHGVVAGKYNPGTGEVWKPEIALPWEIKEGLDSRFGFSRVQSCRSTEAVTGYCAKYVLKGSRRADHYDIFGEKESWGIG
jgi:hypothetical protein